MLFHSLDCSDKAFEDYCEVLKSQQSEKFLCVFLSLVTFLNVVFFIVIYNIDVEPVRLYMNFPNIYITHLALMFLSFCLITSLLVCGISYMEDYDVKKLNSQIQEEREKRQRWKMICSRWQRVTDRVCDRDTEEKVILHDDVERVTSSSSV